MITILLVDKNENEVTRISEKSAGLSPSKSNSGYLIQAEGSRNGEEKFNYLGWVDEYSPTLFSRDKMPGLIHELLLLKQQVSHPEQIHHLDDIIQLARLCHKLPGTALIFTPFGELYGRGRKRIESL